MSEPKRRPGRPPISPGDTPAIVHLRLPSRDYDRAHEVAERRHTSIPALLRRGLTRVLDEDAEEEE